MGRLETIGVMLLWKSVAAENRARPEDRLTADGPMTRIVGGGIVGPVERYPYMAGFYPSRGCGAVLIHPRVLLTAAHCGDSAAVYPTSVDVGRWNRAEVVDGDDFDTHNIQDYLQHPGWTGALGTPDFALMLLETTSDMAPVTLARERDDAPAGAAAIVVGWGRVDDTSTYTSEVLKEANTRITTYIACARLVGFGAATYELCADGVDGQSCNGDSGGPLIIKDAGGGATKDLLVGLVSYGPVRCRDNFGAYARVSWAYNWIKETLQDRWGLTLLDPTASPVSTPSASPSESSSDTPSTSPSTLRSKSPSISPSVPPTASSSDTPSKSPSASPSASPSTSPSVSPSESPSNTPSTSPSTLRSKSSSISPSVPPTASSSGIPSKFPSASPSASPSTSPSVSPSESPSNTPSTPPSTLRSKSPDISSSVPLTVSSSGIPSKSPSASTSAPPSESLSNSPSESPSASPSELIDNTRNKSSRTAIKTSKKPKASKMKASKSKASKSKMSKGKTAKTRTSQESNVNPFS